MNYDFQFDKNRYRVSQCPCGKSNLDGKFTPYVGYDDKGYCFGCGESYLPYGVKNSSTELQKAVNRQHKVD